jgi:hypothetical protein
MNNELVMEKNWWERNKISISISTGVLLVVLSLAFLLGNNVVNFLGVTLDSSIYENALVKVQTNKRVIELLGNIKPIDKIAVLEGNVEYFNNDTTIEMSFRITGSKAKGKIDIYAVKKGKNWEYKKINIRIKKPMETIKIFP